MASHPAVTVPSPATGASVPPLRQLWQVPTFVLGLLAVVGVWLARPLWQPPAVPAVERDLLALRHIVQERTFDDREALALTEGVLRQVRQAPQLAGQAHFLAGSLHVLIAEKTSATTARDHWRNARVHLEQAEALGVPDDDRVRLRYRLGKAWAQTGQAPQRVIECLARSIEEGADDPEDAFRGYGHLAEAYLRLNEPNIEAALAATEGQLRQPILNDPLLAPARLQRGDLLLRLGRAEEAREVLRNVGVGAPPEVAARARQLRIRSLEEDGLWAEAAIAWREALDDPRAPPGDRPAALYHLGLCLRNADDRPAAVKAWEECVRLGAPSDETTAAALGLAELLIGEGRPEALAAFERAVRDVKAPADWRNGLVSLEQARTVFEAGCRALREGRRSELSVRLARLYERLAPPGRAQELRGQAAEAAGQPAQAGEAYEEAAALRPAPAEQGEMLWRAANRYFDAREWKRAAAAFERFLQVGQQPEVVADGRFTARMGEGWYRLAEAHRAMTNEAAAQSAYLECLKWPGRYAYKARYQLGAAQKAWGRSDDARDILEQNLRLLRAAREDYDAEAMEKTLYALGDLYFTRCREVGQDRRKELSDELTSGITSLEAALEQFPLSPQAIWGRFQLAELYGLSADRLGLSLAPHERISLETRLRIEQEVGALREKAERHYRELSRMLLAKASREPAEEELLTYAQFKAVECRYWHGDYEGAARQYEELAERYKGRPERVRALFGVVWCYGTLVRVHGAASPPGKDFLARKQKAFEVIRAALKDLPEPSRKHFEDALKVYGAPETLGRQP